MKILWIEFQLYSTSGHPLRLLLLVGGGGVGEPTTGLQTPPPPPTPYWGQPQECEPLSGSCKVLTRRSASVYTHVALLSQLHFTFSPSSAPCIFFSYLICVFVLNFIIMIIFSHVGPTLVHYGDCACIGSKQFYSISAPTDFTRHQMDYVSNSFDTYLVICTDGISPLYEHNASQTGPRNLIVIFFKNTIILLTGICKDML